MSGYPSAPGLPADLAGATAATRYVGGTASGSPASGTFHVGDFVIDQSGFTWVCTVAGSPGTWVSGQSSGGVSNATATAIASGTGGVSGGITFATNNNVQGAFSFSGAFELYGKSTGAVVNHEPLINIYDNNSGGGNVLKWQLGLDVANSVNDDFFIARGITSGGVQDTLYAVNQGTGTSPIVAWGVNYTPPPAGYSLAVAASNVSGRGALKLLMTASATGAYLNAIRSAGDTMFQISNDGSVRGVDNAVSSSGLVVADVGADASNVLSVVGRTTASAAIMRVLVSGAAGEWRISRDGTTDVQATLHGSGGVNTFNVRTQSQICTMIANSASDAILLLQMAATPSAVPFKIQTSAAALLFQVGQTGNVTMFDGGNLNLGTVTGTKIGTVGGAAGQKIGFFNQTPIVQPLLATGAAHTVDDVITTLQNLGLCRQS